jgi:hypothetical protein
LVATLLLSRVDYLGAFQPPRQEADAPIDLAGVRRELGLPQSRIRAADTKLYFAGVGAR